MDNFHHQTVQNQEYFSILLARKTKKQLTFFKMETKKFEEMSNEELLKNEKMISAVTYTLVGMLLLLFGLGIFLTFKKGFTALTVVPIALLPIVVINFSNIKKIKAERKLRGL